VHKGYDKISNIPEGFTSKKFAQGWYYVVNDQALVFRLDYSGVIYRVPDASLLG
jgi:hypothetical protein